MASGITNKPVEMSISIFSVAVFRIIFVTLVLALSATACTQNKLPIIKSTKDAISIKDGEGAKKSGWRLNSNLKPDIYNAQLIDGKPHKVIFITDVDSISFMVEEGNKYDFIIQKGEELYYTQIVGKRHIPAAVFDKEYQSAHRGKIFVEVPEVYELVNVALSLTPTLSQTQYMVYKDSDYYARMVQWFDKHRSHPLIGSLEKVVQKELVHYVKLKSNGYAFKFDNNSRIVQSKIYDRIGFWGSNDLREYLDQMQSFSDDSNFREFYKQNAKTYQDQITFYRDTANIAGMVDWLDKNFPNSKSYDAYKVIFSPLVYGTQNAAWFESNGFKELQAHVNFPYPWERKDKSGRKIKMKKKTDTLLRTVTVFTEINHGYINPEAEKYTDRILEAAADQDKWVDRSINPYYNGGMAVFLEYMNWGLIDLLANDLLPAGDHGIVMDSINKQMVKGRGFRQFNEFSKNLLKLYRNRKPGQTIADLYPQIIEWFENNKP
ncbi:MAG: DUF4932 domain-containing protein [Gammaproteobacteria bacterium]|nr:DUF4932 domain-containing protein [Gammaproteobacteria bacterium]